MKETYFNSIGDYYDRQDKISELGGENDLKVYDRGHWVSIHEFLKERS